MHVRIVTLVENTAPKPGILAEHGLSILVDVSGLSVMLDCGETDVVARNARAMGMDLARIRHLVVSHGHRDHAGGLMDLLGSARASIVVHAHPDMWKPRYALLQGGELSFRGVPFVREQLESLGAKFNLAEGPAQLAEHVLTTGPIPLRTDFEELDQNLVIRTPEGLRQDEVLDDQALVLRTPKGLVVLLGCAHRGMINTLMRAQEISGEERIYAVLGGTHLGFSSQSQVEQSVAALKEMGVENIGVSHCTGLSAAAVLSREFGNRFFYNNVGTCIEWEFS